MFCIPQFVPGANSHEELIVWQLANELKLEVYRLLKQASVARDRDFCGQLRRSTSSATRNVVEGFGRYLPREFIKYLRWANGELKETADALRDGCDRGYFSESDVVRLQRLSKRASKAATRLIAYLHTAKPPDQQCRKAADAPNPLNPKNQLNPIEPLEPLEQNLLNLLNLLHPLNP